MKRISNKLTVSMSALSTPASAAKISEELLKEEFTHIQLMMSTKKMKDFNHIASTYPSACSVANFAKNRYQDVLPEGKYANFVLETHILFVRNDKGETWIHQRRRRF
jgi:hypothetical protein